MQNYLYNTQDMKQIDMVEYREKLGYKALKINNNDYWFLSPLREEKEASFKINRRLDLWFDHGSGKGGNFIDFALLYHNCSFRELLENITSSNSLFFHQQTATVQQPQANTQSLSEALEPTIKVIAAKRITHPVLCRYLNERKIPVEIAEKFCKEVDFELNDRKYYSIGFENRSGGFELRNSFFKGSSSPKDVTLITTTGAKKHFCFRRVF